ncbi:MAG: PAS domain S-box protein [Candidatus Krumholzibacteria bacterium]|nr:PAS domain S-box protein [Candidatus Krumholzibacteria bacterium]
MSTNRIKIALVGEGRSLSDMLAGLANRSRLLRLKIVAVIDLGTDTDSPAHQHARDIGIPLISSHVADLSGLPELGLVIMTSEMPEVLAQLRSIIPTDLPIMGPNSHDVINGMVRLVDINRSLRADSRRLKETRLRLNQFVETAPLAIYVKDTELRYRKMNKHALNMLGVREDLVLGKSDRTLYPAGGARWLQKIEQETLRTRQTLHGTGILPIQGQDMHVHVTLFPLIENGMIEGLYGLVEDTTELYESERKLHRVDEQLSETQKYLREVLENSRDIIFLTDPEGNLLSFNSGAETVLGFSRDEVVGTPAHRLCATPGSFDHLFAEALRDGHAMSYESEFRTKDLENIIVNISLTLIDGPDGKPLELVCICRDITTRLRLKQDLIRSERLAAVGQMASGIAHEINNPLAVIDTIAGLVEEMLADEGKILPSETRGILTRAMDRLHHQVRRVTTITHSMLGFVRSPETGMAKMEIGGLLEECLNLLGTEIRRSRTEVRRIFAPDLPSFISDPMLLEQVFVNLIKNAVDAVAEAPSRKGLIEILTTLDDNHIRVSIEDNGVGIPKADQEKIFNLFHTTKPAGKGTGLGLSIVHDILHQLGGSVRVASEPGQWTRFVVEIPLVPPETPLPDPSVSI